MAPARPKVLLSINSSWNIWNFRGGLIQALIAEGYAVTAVAPPDAHSARLEALGCRFVPFNIDSANTNPLGEIGLIRRYLALLRRERPDVYLGWTVKPNIYGSLAAHVLGIPVINNVSGLGTVFIHRGWITRIVKALYRVALRRSATVFFQNTEDRNLFLAQGLVRPERVAVLPGSGIDLERFRPVADPETGAGEPRPVVFLLVARLLWDKGVGEFVEAARRIRAERGNASFCILGFLDARNHTAIPPGVVEGWVAEGVIEYLGATDDVRPFLAAADCVVLPSYREGTPRSLLEAAAMARPRISTDVPGCRDVVDDGVNGFLCEVRSGTALAEVMTRFLDLGPEARAAMGRASRAKMEREYDEAIVIDAYRRVLHGIRAARTAPA
jgi:glycosyltransferase involved in cell wall biosynthesis